MAILSDKGHVLIVDDEETIVTIVADVLEQAGYTTVSAESGETALDVYAVNTVDIVITDIRMGGMDGFELIRHLKLLNQDLHIIVMTGFDSYETVLQALQSGAYDYMQKPLDNHAKLLSKVDRACASAKLIQQNSRLLKELASSHASLADANRNLVEANLRLKRMASTDSLTLLYNRRYFDQIIERELARRNRYSLALSLVMVDIDNFKEINDTYGHNAGDEALKRVANVITDSARTSDVVCRYGGEEFAVVLPQTDPVKAVIFAERTRLALEEQVFEIEGEYLKLTISLGIAGVVSTNGIVDTRMLVSAADKALYEAKTTGRNRYVCAPVFDGTEDNDQKAA